MLNSQLCYYPEYGRRERDLLARLADHLKKKLDAGMTSVAEPLESVLISIADMDCGCGRSCPGACGVGRRGGVVLQVRFPPREETRRSPVVFGPP